MSISKGNTVEFTPKKGKTRKGTVEKISRSRGLAKVTLEGDPFPVTVQLDQLTSCEENRNNVSSTKVRKSRTTEGESKPMTTTRTSAKELRKQAQALGIEDWEDMGRDELTKAVKKAKAEESKSSKTTTRKRRSTSKSTKTKKAPAKKKATAKKAATKKAAPKKASASKKEAKSSSEPAYTDPPKGVEVEEAGNPFRKGSNLHLIYPILVPRGGKRRTLAERLQKKVDIHPYTNDEGDIDLLDYDKRIILAAQTLRDKHGYAIERKGRGLDGTIRVFAPGSEDDPRSSSNGRAKGKKRSKKK